MKWFVRRRNWALHDSVSRKEIVWTRRNRANVKPLVAKSLKVKKIQGTEGFTIQ